MKSQRLLSINNHYYRRGGAEVVFLEHNRMLEEDGWEIIPFSAKHPERLKSEWDNYFIDVGEPMTLREKVARAPQVLYSFEAARKIRSLIERVQPTIAHAHNIYHLISPSVLRVVAQSGIPVFMTLHDLKLACPNYKMLAKDGVCERCKHGDIWNVVRHKCVKDSFAQSLLIFLETTVHRYLDIYKKHVRRFVVPSRFFIEKFVEWGWDRDRFIYIPNFVDIDSFSRSGEGGDSFLYVGRLSREKGVHTMIEAVARSGVRLVIAGKGPEEAALRNSVERSGAKVTFVGHLSAAEICAAIATCRAVVLPSECYENAPLSVLESYAGGRPVIGAKIGGIPELICEGLSGATFESGNVDALASALSNFALLGSADLKEMGRFGREWALRDFSRESYKSRILSLYDAHKLS